MWIVIECFDLDFPSIVNNTEGFPLLFENEEEALKEAECQNGKIFQISKDGN